MTKKWKFYALNILTDCTGSKALTRKNFKCENDICSSSTVTGLFRFDVKRYTPPLSPEAAEHFPYKEMAICTGYFRHDDGRYEYSYHRFYALMSDGAYMIPEDEMTALLEISQSKRTA